MSLLRHSCDNRIPMVQRAALNDGDKDYLLVYDCVVNGLETSREIAAELDWPLKVVSAHLSFLADQCLIARVGWTKYLSEDGRIPGPRTNRWSASEAAVNAELVRQMRSDFNVPR